MYYEISFFQKTMMASEGHSGRRFDYFEAANEKEAEEKLRQKKLVHSIEYIKEVTEEVYTSIYNENSNPLMIYSIPLDSLPFKFNETETINSVPTKSKTKDDSDSVKVTIVSTGASFQEETKND